MSVKKGIKSLILASCLLSGNLQNFAVMLVFFNQGPVTRCNNFSCNAILLLKDVKLPNTCFITVC